MTTDIAIQSSAPLQRVRRRFPTIGRLTAFLVVSLICSWLAACTQALLWPPMPVLELYRSGPSPQDPLAIQVPGWPTARYADGLTRWLLYRYAPERRAMSCEVYGPLIPAWQVLVFRDDWESPLGIATPWRRSLTYVDMNSGSRPRVLPILPRPEWLVLDVAVWAVVIVAARAALRGGRGWWRTRRGLCAACAHPLTGLAASAPCTECGRTRAVHSPGIHSASPLPPPHTRPPPSSNP